MNVSAKLQDTSDTKLTMSITMTLTEWKRLHTKLMGGDLNYVADDLARQIRTVLGRVEQTFDAHDLTQQ